MKTTTIIIAGLSALAIVLLFGWVIPDYPFIKRISPDKAKKMYEDFKTTGAKALSGDFPAEADKADRIGERLTRAGYKFDPLGKGSLWYPKYAI